MAAQTLALIKAEVGHFLGYTSTSANWSTEQESDIDEAVLRGERLFYNPPRIREGVLPHRWSFLEPTIHTVTTASGTYQYTLAATVGRVRHVQVTYANADNKFTPVELVGEAEILALRQIDTSNGVPNRAAVRTIDNTAGTAIPRRELITWPTADGAYTLTLLTEVIPTALGGAVIYHQGGEQYDATFLAACCAEGEYRQDQRYGPAFQKFLLHLESSIELDKRANGPRILGKNLNKRRRVIGTRKLRYASSIYQGYPT